MNISMVIGNLGSDAEVVNNNGQSFITLSIADSRKYKKQDGTEVTQTNWVDAIISNANHPVLPFLKQGVKVCVIGNSSLRVYSSKKDRMMKAGQTIHVLSIELCGGSSDDVPRQLIDPTSGALHNVYKFYAVKPEEVLQENEQEKILVDKGGREFKVQQGGWIIPIQTAQNDALQDGQQDAQSNAENNANVTES